jgi:hypothetical protein
VVATTLGPPPNARVDEGGDREDDLDDAPDGIAQKVEHCTPPTQSTECGSVPPPTVEDQTTSFRAGLGLRVETNSYDGSLVPAPEFSECMGRFPISKSVEDQHVYRL